MPPLRLAISPNLVRLPRKATHTSQMLMQSAVIAAASMLPLFATAAPLQGLGQPINDTALVGGKTITFDNPGTFSGNSLTIDDVTITSGGPNFSVTSALAGGYNTTGPYLETQGQVTKFTFSFATPVIAAAFNFGASDEDWSLTAFNGTEILETLTIAPTGSSNNKEYFGLESSGITRLELLAPRSDYILLDNFTYKPGVIPSINTVNISAIGDSEVTLSWTATADSRWPITKYTVTGIPGGSCTTETVAPATEPANSCTITGLTNGTPYKFKVIATNSIGDSTPSAESAEAIPSADLRFADAEPVIALPKGVVGSAYSQALNVTGGLPPYAFSVTGNLPEGLTLDTANGLVSGTPTTAGSYSFTVMAADSTLHAELTAKAVHAVEQNFTLQIAAAAVVERAPEPVPALGSFGLILLTGLLGGIAGFTRRKKSA